MLLRKRFQRSNNKKKQSTHTLYTNTKLEIARRIAKQQKNTEKVQHLYNFVAGFLFVEWKKECNCAHGEQCVSDVVEHEM